MITKVLSKKLIFPALVGFSLVGISMSLLAKGYLPAITMLLLEEELDDRVKAFITGKLNDTGVTNSGGQSGECAVDLATVSQDCHVGLDVRPETSAIPNNGFDFTRIGEGGVELDALAQQTEVCALLDNVTGLMWDSGLNSPFKNIESTFTYYDGTRGVPKHPSSPVTCLGYVADQPQTFCNTRAFVARINQMNWCGYSDWRLPTVNELFSLKDFGQSNFVLLPDDFVFTSPSNHTKWTSTKYLNITEFQQAVAFGSESGSAGNVNSDALAIKLVRND